jgi:hypothetical protein
MGARKQGLNPVLPGADLKIGHYGSTRCNSREA